MIRTDRGIMSFSNIMGTALINAIKLEEATPSGPHLIIDERIDGRFDLDNLVLLNPEQPSLLVNWISSDPPLLEGLWSDLAEQRPDSEQLRKQLRKYLTDNDLPQEWQANAEKLLAGH